MKITIDIDCTPAEARAFMGLPDVAPMQEKLIEKMQDKIIGTVETMDPMDMLKTWLPTGIEGLDKMQSMFWSQMSSAMGGSGDSKTKKSD